jgi:peptide/nickel transport system substrate-binding protein
LAIALLGIFITFNKDSLSSLPRRGGSLTEGVVGTPRFINPLLAQKEVDRDLTMLIYSGLLRLDKDGDLQNDLAQSYEVNADGTVYTFTLKEGLTFHDGTIITADDILYTVALAQNGSLKSTVQSTWNSVLAEKVDDATITFTISEAYAPFAHNLTLGIVPKHIWDSVPIEDFLFSEFNTRPVGSGPYRISNIQESNGVPTQYSLQAFDNFALGRPYIESLTIKIYPEAQDLKDAYSKGQIDSAYNIDATRSNTIAHSGTLPRVFAVYLNQNEAPLFAKKAIREAFMLAINKDDLIEEVLSGNAEKLAGPIPITLYPYDSIGSRSPASPSVQASRDAFEALSYTFNEETKLLEDEDSATIAFTLTTANVPQLVAVGEYLVAQWREVGIDANIEIYDSIDLTQRVIRPRDYQGLLFGQVLPHGLDIYSFWHSSQRNDPGLNIAQYTNIDVDKALTNLRTEQNDATRAQLYAVFNREIENDAPALFLFSPHYQYVYPEKNTVSIPNFIINSSERFALIHTWYTETDLVWPFIKKLYE